MALFKLYGPLWHCENNCDDSHNFYLHRLGNIQFGWFFWAAVSYRMRWQRQMKFGQMTAREWNRKKLIILVQRDYLGWLFTETLQFERFNRDQVEITSWCFSKLFRRLEWIISSWNEHSNHRFILVPYSWICYISKFGLTTYYLKLNVVPIGNLIYF